MSVPPTVGLPLCCSGLSVVLGLAVRARVDGDRHPGSGFRDRADVLGDPTVSTHLDLSEPVALYQSATLHHQTDDVDLPGVMRSYVDALAPGSFVVLSHFWDPGGEDGAQVRRIRDIMLAQGLDGEHFRSLDEIRAMLPGLDILPGNPGDTDGLIPLLDWWPDGPATDGAVDPVLRCIVGAVGRKP